MASRERAQQRHPRAYGRGRWDLGSKLHWRRSKADPRFGPFALRLIDERRGELRDSTVAYLEWGLSHVLGYFADLPLRAIDAAGVDAYRAAKVRQAEARRRALETGCPERDRGGRILRPLSPASINKTIDVLQWVLAVAEDYGWVDRNPARGRRRRMRCEKRAPVYVDSALQIVALLQAAEQLDRQPRSRVRDRLPQIGALIFAGLRSGELGALRRRDVELDARRILVRQSKSAAGQREVTVLPILRSLLARKEGLSPCRQPHELAFATRTGRGRSKDNIRARVLLPASDRADELLEQEGRPPLPLGLSPHKLRHTFASILIACGEDPAAVMYQLGHTSPEFTLKTYTHMMRRDATERDRLRSLVGSGWELPSG